MQQCAERRQKEEACLSPHHVATRKTASAGRGSRLTLA